MSTLLIILLVLVVLGVGGGVGYSRFGWAGFSPLGLILVVFLILWLTGGLR